MVWFVFGVFAWVLGWEVMEWITYSHCIALFMMSTLVWRRDGYHEIVLIGSLTKGLTLLYYFLTATQEYAENM